ncbi:MAG: MBL fold metallo-hydrolase [Bryobacteraceae bacterium]
MKLAAYFLVLGMTALAARPVQEISSSAGSVKITPIQHASLMIEAGGKVLYVDPGQGDYEGLPAADFVLITDIHGDHMDPKTLAKVAKAGTVVLAPQAVAKTIATATVINNGETKQAGPWRIEAVPMYNLQRGPTPGKLYHDKGRGNGYILTFGGKRFYISGDTEGVPEMKALKNIDVAFVCMNLPYTMPPDEAAAAVRAFLPKTVYPYHYRGSDLKTFEAGLQGSGVTVKLLDWYYKE